MNTRKNLSPSTYKLIEDIPAWLELTYSFDKDDYCYKGGCLDFAGNELTLYQLQAAADIPGPVTLVKGNGQPMDTCIVIRLKEVNVFTAIGTSHLCLYRKRTSIPLAVWECYISDQSLVVPVGQVLKDLTDGDYFFSLDNVSFENAADVYDNRAYFEFTFEKIAPVEKEEVCLPLRNLSVVKGWKEGVSILDLTLTFLDPVEKEAFMQAILYTESWRTMDSAESALLRGETGAAYRFRHPLLVLGGTYHLIVYVDFQAAVSICFTVDGEKDEVTIQDVSRVDRNDAFGMVCNYCVNAYMWKEHCCAFPGLDGIRKRVAEDIRFFQYLKSHYGQRNYKRRYVVVGNDPEITGRAAEIISNSVFGKYPQPLDLRTVIPDEEYLVRNMVGLELDTSVSYRISGVEVLMYSASAGVAFNLEDFLRKNPDSVVGLCCTESELDALRRLHPSLMEHFVAEQVYHVNEITAIDALIYVHHLAAEGGLTLEDEAVQTLYGYFQTPGVLAHMDVPGLKRFLQENILLPMIRSGSVTGDGPVRVTAEQLVLPVIVQGQDEFSVVMEELDAMVGLSGVKRQVAAMFNVIRYNRMREQAGLPVFQEPVHHMVFTGSPGTGKTTVATLLGRIFKALGILSKGDVVVTERKELVAKWIGHTEENIRRKIEEAKGCVLFIDEAYTLNDESDSKRDFGKHVIEGLMTILAKPHSDVIVVLAGYPKEMDSLFHNHKGLEGRFPYHLEFPDYSAEELFTMAMNHLARLKMIVPNAVSDLLKAYISRKEQDKKEELSNGRWVQQLVMNRLMPVVAERVMGGDMDGQMNTLLEEDVRKVMALEMNARKKDTSERRVVRGFQTG